MIQPLTRRLVRRHGCYNGSMRRRRVTLFAPVVLSGLVLVACGGDEQVAVPDGRSLPPLDESSSTVAAVSDAVTSTTVPPVEVAERVFDALATRDAAQIAEVLDATVPGSPAAVFVEHQGRVAELLDAYAAPASTTTSTTVATSDTTSSTSTTLAAPVVTAPDGVGSVCVTAFDCTVFAEPEFDAAGLLRSFSIDRVPVGDLVRSAGPVVAAEAVPVQMRVVSAYRTASQRVSVLVEVVNGSETAVSPFVFAAVHRHRTVADGSNGVVEAEGAWGPPAVEPGQSSRHLIVFGTGPVDGEVLVNAVTADGLDLAFALPLLSP